MIKILYLCDTPLQKAGGAQLSMRILAEGLADSFEIQFLTPASQRFYNNQIILDKFPSFVLRGKSPFQWLHMASAIQQEIRKANPDIIHLQMTSSLVLVAFLKFTRQLDSWIKIYFTDRGVYGKFGFLTTLATDYIVKHADQVVTTTLDNQNNYRRRYANFARDAAKFSIIYNTAGKRYDRYDPNLGAILRQELGFSTEDQIIGLCGRFGEQKDWPMARDILFELNQKVSTFKVIIVLGTDGSKTHREAAETYIRSIVEVLGPSRVTPFIDLDNATLSDYYYAMDLFLISSKWESFGRTAVEAMARGSIVVARKIDGLVEVVRDPTRLYDNVSEASAILENLLSDATLREAKKQECLARYRAHFTTEVNFSRYNELYRHVIVEEKEC